MLSREERTFYTDLAVTVTALGTGPLLLTETPYFYTGITLTVVGLAGAIWLRQQPRKPRPADAVDASSPSSISLLSRFPMRAVLLVLLWVAIGYIFYDLYRRQAPSPTQPVADSTKTLVPAAVVTVTVHEPCPSAASTPHQMTPEQAFDFLYRCRSLQGTVPIMVTAAQGNEALRDTLIDVLSFPEAVAATSGLSKWGEQLGPPGSQYLQFSTGPVVFSGRGFSPDKSVPRFAGFEIATPVPSPTPNPDVDAAPIPTPAPIQFPKNEIIVHAAKNSANADALVGFLQHLGLNVLRGSQYPSDAPAVPGLIYVQIGSGSPWK